VKQKKVKITSAELEREIGLNQKLAKISEHPIFSGFDRTFFPSGNTLFEPFEFLTH